jgi:NADH dehydrogenase FAD-containing subunit
MVKVVSSLAQKASSRAEGGRIAVDPWLRAIGGNGDILALGDCSCIVSRQLPATAQVASQQGEYLARLFSQNYNICPGMDPQDGILLPPQADPNRSKSLSENIAAFACQAGDFAAPFQFLNLGILAYTGAGSALAQLQLTPAEQARLKGTGQVGFSLWRSVYLAKQISWRNRVLVFFDWAKNQIFGRDITRI